MVVVVSGRLFVWVGECGGRSSPILDTLEMGGIWSGWPEEEQGKGCMGAVQGANCVHSFAGRDATAFATHAKRVCVL